VTLWAIWYARRKAIHENTFQSPLSTYYFVTKFVADLQNSKPHKGEKTVAQTRPRWIPPPVGMLKINVDATLSKSSSFASAAVVARDIEGNFLEHQLWS
jgi:hypothetical protein